MLVVRIVIRKFQILGLYLLLLQNWNWIVPTLPRRSLHTSGQESPTLVSVGDSRVGPWAEGKSYLEVPLSQLVPFTVRHPGVLNSPDTRVVGNREGDGWKDFDTRPLIRLRETPSIRRPLERRGLWYVLEWTLSIRTTSPSVTLGKAKVRKRNDRYQTTEIFLIQTFFLCQRTRNCEQCYVLQRPQQPIPLLSVSEGRRLTNHREGEQFLHRVPCILFILTSVRRPSTSPVTRIHLFVVDARSPPSLDTHGHANMYTWLQP